MKNKNKIYNAQGLVVDVKGGARLVLCQTGPYLYRFISLYSDSRFGVTANRLNDEEKYLGTHKITRSDVFVWLRKSGSAWTPKRIIAPKKIRIVCS